MNLHNPEQQLALEILNAYVKGTPNRNSPKGWENKIIDMCLKPLGATEFFRGKKCKCGGFYVLVNNYAICPFCEEESKDFRIVKVHCKQCKKLFNQYAWSADEEKKILDGAYNYCGKCW